MLRRGILLAGVVLATLTGFPARAADDPALDGAKAAALTWLVFADQGNATLTWQTAAPVFQAALSRDRWQIALTAARAPLGRVLSRDLKEATATNSLPGAPDGDYVVIQYQTVFQFKAQATETITPVRDAQGHWRVAGYYIQ
jgi:hypothetical protein